MTERERQFASFGFEYSEGIEQAFTVHIPNSEETIERAVDIGDSAWSVRPWNLENHVVCFDLLDALKLATRPTAGDMAHCFTNLN